MFDILIFIHVFSVLLLILTFAISNYGICIGTFILLRILWDRCPKWHYIPCVFYETNIIRDDVYRSFLSVLIIYRPVNIYYSFLSSFFIGHPTSLITDSSSLRIPVVPPIYFIPVPAHRPSYNRFFLSSDITRSPH